MRGAVDREAPSRPDIADLGQILDIDPVIGQLGADRLEVFALRAERCRRGRARVLRLQRLELVLRDGRLMLRRSSAWWSAASAGLASATMPSAGR